VITGIYKEAQRRGIRRLCHFTPSRQLFPILRSGAILATKYLEDDSRAVYHPSDLQRLDGFKDHVCCSIEYPNTWYFRRAQAGEVNFPEWVVLLLRPAYLWMEGVKFCPRNASASSGRLIAGGEVAFQRLYANQITGAYGRVYHRTVNHLPYCPTDDQAEVLIPGVIPRTDILAIAVASEDQARMEYHRLRLLLPQAGIPFDIPPLVVAPHMYDPGMLRQAISTGRRPIELAWEAKPPATKPSVTR